MKRVLLLSALIAVPLAAPAATTTVPLGRLAIAYDPDRWTVTAFTRDAGAGMAETLRFTCVAPECRDRPFAHASATPAKAPGAPACPPDRESDDWLSELRRLDRPPGVPDGPVPLTYSVRFSNCRAYTPAALSACGIREGIVYTFATGANFGCRGIRGVPDAAFAELIGGLRGPEPGAPQGKPGGEAISPAPTP